MKTKLLNIFFSILYYSLGILGFYFLFIMGIISGIQSLTFWFYLIFAIIPLIVLALPIIIKLITKKSFYRCILYSGLGVILYFIVLLVFLYSLYTFSESKWNNEKYINLRYLMTYDLEEKYSLIGMGKYEVEKILGKKDLSMGDSDCYQIGTFMISTSYYCLEYDEFDKVINITEKEID